MSSSTSNSKERRAILALALGAAVTLAAVTAGAAALLTKVFHRPNWKTMAVAALSPSTRTLFMGSSTFYFGLDPRLYPDSVNLSTNYASCRVMQDLWHAHAAKVPGVRLVVLEMNLSTFFYDTAHLDVNGLADVGLDTAPRLADFRADFDAATHRMLRPIFAWRLTPYFFEEFAYRMADDGEPKHLVPGYIPSSLKLAIPAAYAEREVEKAKKHLEGFGRMHYGENVAACASLVRQLMEKGIKVTFLRMPRDAELRKVYPSAWDAQVEGAYGDLAARIKPRVVPVQDDRAFADLTSEHFRDPDHLNAEGAQRLATHLSPLLTSLLLAE